MRIEQTVVNVIFDAAKGTVSVSSREAVSGRALGALPRPVRAGYDFVGWTWNGDSVTEETVLTGDEDVRLVARWEKKKGGRAPSMLKRQKLAVAVLAALTVVLIVALLVVNHVITIYSFQDVYYKDGVEYSDKYYVKKKDGVYALFDKDGNRMEQNEDGYYIAAVSGNQYSINAETGEWELYAVVDYDSAGGESLGFNDRIMIFPQITQKNTYSIEVTNEYGSFKFYRDAAGTVHIEGTEQSLVSYNQELFASLCVSCGYTLTMQKLDLTSETSAAPRLPDGSVDYSAYGLGPDDTPATYTVTKAIYAEDGTCTADPNTKYTMRVGDAILSGGGYYVQLEGRSAVYIVSSSLANTVLQPVEALVTPAIVYPMSTTTYAMAHNFLLGKTDFGKLLEKGEDEEVDPDEIDLDVIVAFNYLDLENRNNSIYSANPYQCGIELMSGYTLNDDSVSKVMSLFYEMEFVACKKLGFDKEDLKEYGLDQDVYYITFETPVLDENNYIGGYVTNSIFINPNKTENGTYYVASPLYDMIVEVDQYYFSYLEWGESKWYDQYFFQNNIAYISDLKLQFRDTATGGWKTFTFTLDNSASYMYYEYEKGKLKLIDMEKGSISRSESGEVTYTDKNGVNYVAHALNFKDGGYYLRINHLTKGTVDYEPYERYLLTVDRDGNRVLQTVVKDANGKDEIHTYNLTEGSTTLRTYKLIYRDAAGTEYDVLGTYASNGKTFNDYFRLNYWQEVMGKDDKGNDAYVWEREAPVNSASYLFLRDAEGKVYEVAVGSNNLVVSSVEYGGVLDYTIVHTYTTDKGTEKTETISAISNFRKLYSMLLWFSIEGDVDEEEFKKNIGLLTGTEMTMDEYIALGDNACQAIFTYRVSDMAELMNLIAAPEKNEEKSVEEKWWTNNNEMDVVIRFYAYSSYRSMITVEVVEKYDENGNPISDPTKAAGRFYIDPSYLNEMLAASERLLNQERVVQD